MIDYEEVHEIPLVERNFKVTEQTKEIAEILKGMEPGKLLRFPVSGNQPLKDARNESSKIKSRAISATKMVGYGRFKVVTRGFDVYIKRLD